MARDEQEVAEHRLVRSGGCADAGDQFLRDDQQMDRRLRLDVVQQQAQLRRPVVEQVGPDEGRGRVIRLHRETGDAHRAGAAPAPGSRAG